MKIGFIQRDTFGRMVWPFYVAPWWMWKMVLRNLRFFGRVHRWFYVFRNHGRPQVPGQLLPRRWGFGFLRLIEFGQR